MVSFNVYRSTTSGFYVEGVCLITDEKPVVGIANGSILFAVDTSSGETTRFMYDQSTMSWIEAECPCSGGSGGSGGGGSGDGGSGSVGPLIVTMSGEQDTADKTFGEITDALASGRGAVAIFPESADTKEEYLPFVLAEVGKSGYIVEYYSFDMTSKVRSRNTGATAEDFPFFAGGLS